MPPAYNARHVMKQNTNTAPRADANQLAVLDAIDIEWTEIPDTMEAVHGALDTALERATARNKPM